MNPGTITAVSLPQPIKFFRGGRRCVHLWLSMHVHALRRRFSRCGQGATTVRRLLSRVGLAKECNSRENPLHSCTQTSKNKAWLIVKVVSASTQTPRDWRLARSRRCHMCRPRCFCPPRAKLLTRRHGRNPNSSSCLEIVIELHTGLHDRSGDRHRVPSTSGASPGS
jgi:hypothetical protein